MSRFSRRRRSDDAIGDPDDLDNFDELDELEELEDAAPVRPAQPPARRPSAPDDDLRPIRLRDWEIPGGYAVAGFVAVLAVLELLVTHGKGAPTTHSPVLPLIALGVAIGQAATIQFKNRLVTGILGVVAGLVVAYAKVPDSIAVPHAIGFIVPFAYAFIVTQRHSRAQRALQKARPPRPRTSRRGAAKAAPEPAIKPSRRYTPPKPREARDQRRSGTRR